MKLYSRIVGSLFLLFLCITPIWALDETYPVFGGEASQPQMYIISPTAFTTPTMQTGAYTMPFAASDLSLEAIGAESPSGPRKAPGPGGLPGGGGWITGDGTQDDVCGDILPVGDGTWVLMGCAMLFILFRLVLSKRAKATEQ